MDRLTEIYHEAVDFGEEGEAPAGAPVGVVQLSYALRVYNSIQGGGVGFALEANEPFRVGHAIDAFRYFGMAEVAELLADVAESYGAHGHDDEQAAKKDRIEEIVYDGDPLFDAYQVKARTDAKDFGLN